MNQASKKSSWLRQLIVFAVLLAIFSVMGRQINTWLGKRAQEATNLPHYSLEQALAKSKESGKPVITKFAAIWCGACRRLDQQVFSDESVKQLINEDYHFARIDFDKEEDKQWFSKYGVSGFPVLMLMDQNGNIVRNLPTPRTAADLIASLQLN